MLSALNDITEKKKAEYELHKSQQMMRRFASHLQTVGEKVHNVKASQVRAEMKNLFFIGINAPLRQEQCANFTFEYSGSGLSGVMRGLVVQPNHTKKFE
jgi:hypothetical protein